jgi:hypothetical protein
MERLLSVVRIDNGKWWVTSEDGAVIKGPFDSEEEAKAVASQSGWSYDDPWA